MQVAQLTFGTLITCIDGRVQRPTILWMRERYDLDYVDVVSEPGPDKLVAEGSSNEVAPVCYKAGFSIKAHASRIVALCGHYDCAGNPATVEEHHAQIRKGVAVLRAQSLGADIVGLWLNERWEVEVIEPPLHHR